MSNRETYAPGAASGATVRKEGDSWTLVLVRELRHPAAQVWQALTDPAELREWAPFDADRSLGATGPVKLSTVGAPTPQVSETIVTRVEAPRLLEYSWGGNDIRWELEPMPNGTRLTLWHNIDRKYVAMGAAGWHICLDVLDELLGGHPIGRIVAGEAMKFGWKRLNAEYAEQFGIEAANPHPTAREERIAVKIKITSIYVNDQEKALRFYTEVAGFVKTSDFTQGAQFTMPPTRVTGSTIAMLNDTCGNLIQIVTLDRRG
jgi:uncharacterized protein YndB with AHSA1/START domain